MTEVREDRAAQLAAFQKRAANHTLAGDSFGASLDELRGLLSVVAELEQAEACPTCGTAAHFKCAKCGEEWYDHKQSMAHSNQRFAPVLREQRAIIAALEAERTALRVLADEANMMLPDCAPGAWQDLVWRFVAALSRSSSGETPL